MLTTENALFAADDLLVQDKLGHMRALVGLFNALGGGWQDRDIAGAPIVLPVSDGPDPAAAPSLQPREIKEEAL